jgi:hypothetical protein
VCALSSEKLFRSSRAALLKNYPNLSVVATRLVPVGDLGKSQVGLLCCHLLCA